MDQDLRTNIKKTAAKLFLKYGLRSVSIDDICNELRISKKTFYAHFSQKEELIESVLTEHNEKQLKKQGNKFDPCQSDGNAIDQLLRISAFHSSKKNDRFVNFFYDLNKYYPEIHKRMTHRNQEHVREKIRQNILIGIEEHLFRSDIDIELMVRFMSIQFVTLNKLDSKELGIISMGRSVRFMIDLYIRVLSNRQGLDFYENLLSEKSKELQVEDEPMKDEDLDRIIDHIMDNPEDLNEMLKDKVNTK